MKNIVLDMKNMSDSKEVYASRPNPFLTWFVYGVLAIFVIAFIFCFMGKIEIVATASGVVRPNEQISTVTNIVGGRITDVFFDDGQRVEKGAALYSVDSAEAETSLAQLKDSRADYAFQYEMYQRFIAAIDSGKNPFSNDKSSDEYEFYVNFENYILAYRDTETNTSYEADRVKANIDTAESEVLSISEDINGLNLLRSSIEQDTDLTWGHEVYSKRFQSYKLALESLENDYKGQRIKIERDTSADNNARYVTYYQSQIDGYRTLVQSIKDGRSRFSGIDAYSRLYNDYENNLAESSRAYDAAQKKYEYYDRGGAVGNYRNDILSANNVMKEGYQFYKDSVVSGSDAFRNERPSADYRYLYVQYKAEYDLLDNVFAEANDAYDGVLAGGGSAEELQEALEAVTAAAAARDNFKSSTIASINNMLLQINADMAQTEVSLGAASNGYDLAAAELAMESAGAAITAYRARMLAEYELKLEGLEASLAEAKYASDAMVPKTTLLNSLEISYNQSRQDQFFTAITQIDNSIQNLETQLRSANSTLEVNRIADALYRNNRADDGQFTAVSATTIKQISALVDARNGLEDSLKELDLRIMQTEKEIGQARVTAEQSGNVNARMELVRGDVLAAGTVVATIIPAEESEYRVRLYADNKDIASLKVGDRVKYNIAALPSSQYGSVEGEITYISNDVMVQGGSFSGYYMLEGNIRAATLRDKNGNEASVGIGMQVDAKIITQQKRIIFYLLEKINLF